MNNAQINGLGEPKPLKWLLRRISSITWLLIVQASSQLRSHKMQISVYFLLKKKHVEIFTWNWYRFLVACFHWPTSCCKQIT